MKYIIFIIIVILLIRFRNIPEWIWYNNPIRAYVENKPHKNIPSQEERMLILSENKKDRNKYIKKVLKHAPSEAERFKILIEQRILNTRMSNAWTVPQIIVYDDAKKEFGDSIGAYSECIHYTWSEYKKINPPQGMKLPVMNYNKAKSNGAL